MARPLVLCGPSGSGKSTIMNKLTAEQQTDLDLIAGLGLEQCMLVEPVYPGDVLVLKAWYAAKRASRSKPDRGIVTTAFTLTNQNGVEVFRGQGQAMVRRDTPDVPD